MPSRAGTADAAARILAAVAVDSPPWASSAQVAAAALADFDSLADRIAVLELLGAGGLEPARYVDDTTVACPSQGAVRAVASEPESASSRYSHRAKAQINRKPGKTAAMSLLGSPPLDLDDVGCDVVQVHKALGVTIDSDLTFAPLLKEVLAIGWRSFLTLFHTAETGGCSVPTLAGQVPLRVEPIVLYPAAFLI